MFWPPTEDQIGRMAEQGAADHKASWLERAAIAAISSGNDFSLVGLASVYDDIQKYRKIQKSA